MIGVSQLATLVLLATTNVGAWDDFTETKEVTLSFMENLEKMKDIIPGFKLPETTEFKSPDTCDPNEPYSAIPTSLGVGNSCRTFSKTGAKGHLKTTIVLTGAVNKELGVAASARLKLVLALGS